MLGGLWEFPGGKIKASETNNQALNREIKEELNLVIQIDQKYGLVKHAYTHFKISMHVYSCSLLKETLEQNVHDDIKWITKDEIKRFPFPTATKKAFELIGF